MKTDIAESPKPKFTNDELKIFDSARGLSSILVVIAHINITIWTPVVGPGIISEMMSVLANTAVVIFFFLSGVLITFSAINLSKGGEFNYKKFFVNRVTRIYPTLIFSLILVYVLMQLFNFINGSYVIPKLPTDLHSTPGSFYVTPAQILKTIPLLVTNITNINLPMWSLFIEWWLYMSAMFVFIAIKQKLKIAKIIAALLSIFPLLYIYKWFHTSGIFCILIWVLGFMYTMFISKNKTAKFSLLTISIISVIVLAVSEGMIVFNITHTEVIFYGFVQLLYAILFLNFFPKLKFINIFKSFAPFSYTLYLIHFPLILFIHSVLHRYTYNNLFYMGLETILDLIIVITVSYLVAKVTENKNLFRKYFMKVVN